MRKKDRHQVIARLLTEKKIRKQEEFVFFLKEKGINVTQATISRDIKEMRLFKVPEQELGYYYSLPEDAKENTITKLEKIMKEAVISVDQMDKFISLRTIPGNAAAVAKLIEKKYHENLFTVITDDEKILMIAQTHEDAKNLKNQFIHYL